MDLSFLTPAVLLRIAVNVLPVVVFLVLLVVFDSHKLVRRAQVVGAIAAGIVVALVAMQVNRGLLVVLGWDVAPYTVYVGPPVEETLKGVCLVWLIARKRVGFMVDAAIYGFALGTGFAIVENLYYLRALGDANVAISVLRGFGTALMHGGATAIFGIVTKSLFERYGFAKAWIFLPGLGIGIALHMLYNVLLFSPGLAVLCVVVLLPILMWVSFRMGEQTLRQWLGVGFDTDAELLDMICSGAMAKSLIGEYLSSLSDRFPPEVVADMCNLLQIRVELSMRAKGILLAREAGLEVEPTPDIKERFAELDFLEKSIGKTGRLAMQPLLYWRERDLWELHMLGRK